MGHVLDFSNEVNYTATRKNLRMMLWAGDGEHDGITDVQRLRDYDVYLCMNLGDGVKKNSPHLQNGQVICILNVDNVIQMTEFHRIFDGAFVDIYADYIGNTPTLPLTDYLRLLAPAGIAHNIEGINSVIMPTEEILNRLELLAPILSPEGYNKRMWCQGILNLAKRDDLSPAAVWTSPDLKHTAYDGVRHEQERFVMWQKQRNPRWPMRGPTLEEHWAQLPAYTLRVSISRKSLPSDDTVELLEQHLPAFERFLKGKISMPPRIHLAADDYSIHDMQHILKYMDYEMPEGLVGQIGYYWDTRRTGDIFGMRLIRDTI
jgi:hypothetical protein